MNFDFSYLDIAFKNGKVITVNDNNDICQAVGIKNNKIVFVGSDEDIVKIIDEKTAVYGPADASYDEETGVLTLTIPGIAAGKYLEAKFYANVEETAPLGSDLAAALSATVVGQEAAALSDSLNTHINKYSGTKNIYLAGSKMGGWYGNGTPSTAVSTLRNSSTSLDALEGEVFAFDGAFDKQTHSETGYINYSTNTDYYGETVYNQYDGRIWQCVGFVPYTGSIGNGDFDVVSQYVYTETTGDEGFVAGTLEDAQTLIASAGGVLYGQAATPENISAF